ncbi:MAG: PQQ-dependent sugar dehydrogenase [Casimicrobium sp.]
MFEKFIPPSLRVSSLQLAKRIGGFALATIAAGATFAPLAHAQTSAPTLDSTMVINNLDDPWDIAFAPDGAVLFTEKCDGLSVRLANGTIRKLIGNKREYLLRANDFFCQGQSGVHGVAVDPAFAQGQRFVYVFSASDLKKEPRTNRVVRVRVSEDWSRVTDRVDIVDDIAFKEAGILGSPGAHSGGRMRFGPDGFLWVTTGDNHNPTLPQDPKLIGGKVLRIDRDGKAAPNNVVSSGFDSRIFTYGHRNPQGIAFRPTGQPGAGQAFVGEHGPNHTDEVNALVAGGNAGWDPQKRPGLDCWNSGYCGYAGDPKTMPMTDLTRFPNAMRAVWENDGRSQGIGPVEFLSGSQWGAWNGTLAVALMRDRRLDLLTLDAGGKVTRATTAKLPTGMRLRSLVQGPDGALWAASDDQIVRLTLRR